MIKTGNSNNSRCFLLVMSIMVVLVPLFILSFFARPAADDFVWAANYRDTGFLEMQVDYYLNWQGRYFSTPLLAVLAYMSVSSSNYQWHAVVLIILTACSFYYFVTCFFRKVSITDPGLSIRLLASLVLFLLYTYSLPSVAQAFYWLSGAITYQVPVIAMTTLGAMLIGDKPVRYQFLQGIALIILAFITAGSNELSAILLLLFIPIAGKRYRWFQVSIAILVSLAIFSPGSWKRSEMLGDKDFAKILVSIFYWSINVVLGIIREPLFWASLIVSYVSGRLFGTKKQLPANLNKIIPIGVLAFLLLPLVSLSPILWGSNGSVPPRMLNVLVQPMIFIILLCAYFYGSRFHGAEVKGTMDKQLISYSWWIVAFIPLASSQLPRTYENLLQGYFYHKVFQNREKQFSEAASKGSDITFMSYVAATGQALEQCPFMNFVVFREKIGRLPDMIAWFDDYEPRDQQGFIKLYYKRKGDGFEPAN